MADDLFVGLPPPSYTPAPVATEQHDAVATKKGSPAPAPVPAPAPAPILKSALKRDKPTESPIEVAAAPRKHARFKTTTDATETQVIEAMQKIASHIKNLSKFSKAVKLALQLIQAGSVKPGTSDHFFAILEAAMSSPSACTDSSLRADYHALFSAAQDVVEHFSEQQKNQLHTWTIRAVVANDLYTDDSFVFSKAARKIEEAILSLPSANEDDDIEEAAFSSDAQIAVVDTDSHDMKNILSVDSMKPNKESSDPFGLDELLSGSSKKDGKARGRKETADSKVDEEHKRFLRSQREALMFCLEVAARRYNKLWAQTVIDILVKHAFDHMERFTRQQRDAIEKLWASIREQHIKRKQGKSVSGKLDVTAFERLQEKYAHEKISIRHAVGGCGDRRAEQWLG